MEERRFEEWLRGRLPRPRPGEGFGEELRRRFLTGGTADPKPEDSASRGSSALRKGDVSQAPEAFLRLHLPVPRAGEPFRADLRSRFVEGSLGAPEAARLAPSAAIRPRSLRPILRLAAGLAAAAALAAVLLRSGEGEAGASRWRLLGAPEGTRVALAGAELAPEGPLPAITPEASELTVDGGVLRLAFADELRMDVLPGSRVRLDPTGGLALELPEGEVFLRTLPGYGGSGLTVATPETRVAVHGTTLGVRADGEGTCVCVMEGVVEVREPGAEHPIDVPASSSHLVFRDRAMMAKTEPFPAAKTSDAPHASHVGRLRAFYAAH